MTNGQLSSPRRRARREPEKEARRQAILEAAVRVLEDRGFAALTLGEVAQAAGLAKGTIYIYFNTKEEIFLELAESWLLGWFEAVDEGLRRAGPGLFPEPLTPGEAAALLVGGLEGRPLLPRLLAILPTVLEPRVERLAALRFREFLADRCLRTGRLLELALPFLGEGEGAGLMLRIQGLVAGLSGLFEPPEPVQALLDAPGLQLFHQAFRPALEATLASLLAGMEARNPGGV